MFRIFFPSFVVVVAAVLQNSFLIAATPDAGAAVSQAVNLRGYGQVTAEFAPGRCVFTASDAKHADILMGKLLADLFWDAPAQARDGVEIDAGGRRILVHEQPGRGAVAVGRLDNRVVAVDGKDAAAVAAAVAKDPVLADPQSLFKPQENYPTLFDALDLRAVKAYTRGLAGNLAEHWPFLKKFGFGGISYNLGGGLLVAESPAPGVLRVTDDDYEVAEAGRNGGMIVPSFSVGGEMPLWAANAFPESMMQLSPATLGTFTHFRESYGMPLAQREETGLWSMRRLMRRYLDSPAVGAWQIYDGSAGIEFSDQFQPGTDFSPAGLADYRRYLSEVKGLDLAAVGRRYHDNPAAYTSWEQVLPLDEAGFFGNLDETCLRLSGGQWQLAAGATEVPPASDPKWVPMAFPPSEQMQAIPVEDAFYRIRFDARDWLAKNRGKDVYLVCGAIARGQREHAKVWLNGKFLGEQNELTSAFGMEPTAVKVNDVLKPGANELTLFIPKGRIYSPYFLTTHIPEHYPSSDKGLNARYTDLLDWQWHSLVQRHKDVYTLARGLDPDRAITMAGGTESDISGCAELAVKYGLTIQNTGREAYYQPWWTRIGRVGGFYGSSEPSNTTTGDISQPGSLNRLFGHILIDGDTSVILFNAMDGYIEVEKKTGWFTNNHRLVTLVGKSLPRIPQIVVMRSSLSMRYNEGKGAKTWRWDIGRGELNDLHYNWGFADEGMIRKGLPPECKVVFDSDSTTLDQKAVDGILKFVSDGGTFVALHETGRDTPEEVGAWLGSQLTGCKVLPGAGSGAITFGRDLPVFKQWEGREFPGDGAAVDWVGIDSAKGASVRLQPVDPAVQVLAKWLDGTAAVTSRPVGKGRVICLGSTFWRDTADIEGIWRCKNPEVLGALIGGLGIERETDATSNAIWLDNPITKNGLEQWLIAFNTSRDPVTADLKFKLDAKPREVRDITAGGASVPFDYVDGWVVLKDQAFENTQTRVFAADRAGFTAAMPFWWGEKVKYWLRNDFPAATPDTPPDPSKLGTITIDPWKFLADRDGSVGAKDGWASAGFDDSAWDTLATGPWNSLREDLKDYTGVGLYRATFDLPPSWRGSDVTLNLYGRIPPVFGAATFYLNGRKIEDETFLKESVQLAECPFRTDITRFLVPGKNTLAVKIKGGASWGGGTFSGFGGTVYLRESKPLQPRAELKTGWTLVGADNKSSAVHLPLGKVTGKYLACNFDIPPAWRGKKIYLRVATPSSWLFAIMVNGRTAQSPRFSWFGKYAELNITPFLGPEKTCRIELWGRAYAGSDYPKDVKPATEMDLTSAEVGCLL